MSTTACYEINKRWTVQTKLQKVMIINSGAISVTGIVAVFLSVLFIFYYYLIDFFFANSVSVHPKIRCLCFSYDEQNDIIFFIPFSAGDLPEITASLFCYFNNKNNRMNNFLPYWKRAQNWPYTYNKGSLVKTLLFSLSHIGVFLSLYHFCTLLLKTGVFASTLYPRY